MKSKLFVFGVGLQRTGTTSLAAALQHLGWNTLHGVREVIKGVYAYAVDRNESVVRSFRVSKWDAWVCWPVYAYRAFFNYYPDAIWVQTLRDPEQWAKRHGVVVEEDRRLVMKGLLSMLSPRQHIEVVQHMRHFGWHYDSPERLARGAAKLQLEVGRFFRRKRKVRFIQMNVFEGDGWDKLCSALGVDVPDMPFPHLNPKKGGALR